MSEIVEIEICIMVGEEKESMSYILLIKEGKILEMYLMMEVIGSDVKKIRIDVEIIEIGEVKGRENGWRRFDEIRRIESKRL